MTNQTIPSFDSYATAGDFIEWESEGYTIKATLHEDNCTHVRDSDCYSQEQIQAWKKDEWFYVGVVLSVSYNGTEIDDNAARLFGVDCNFPGGNNAYLSECALELQDEAIKQAKIKHKQMIKALTE
jgi:transposase